MRAYIHIAIAYVHNAYVRARMHTYRHTYMHIYIKYIIHTYTNIYLHTIYILTYAHTYSVHS